MPPPDTDPATLRVAVDLHCHILPGIDDGARDLGDAIEMARQAEADGIAAVCATPHIRHDHAVRIEELPERVAELREAVARAGCRTRILGGGEVAATEVTALSSRELAAVTLARAGRWVLLEPAPGPLDDGLDEAVEHLLARGRRALIAHPERHLAQDAVPRLRRLAARGALVQATAAALLEPTTLEGMRSLAAEGVLHVLGSDAHSSRAGRPVTLAPALRVLETIPRTAAHVAWIARHAPNAIASGQELRVPW